MERYGWPARPELIATYSNDYDIFYHASRTTRPYFSFVATVQGPRLPAFRNLVVHRHRCGTRCPSPNLVYKSSPRQRPVSPRLSRLAGDALLPHLLRSDPPLFLDPVDCVIDAVLATADWEVVRSNVTCYIKFLPPGYGEPIHSHSHDIFARPKYGVGRMKSYVNPEMLEQLDWIVTAGKKSTNNCPPLRLLGLALPSPASGYHIDLRCLPTEYPAIVVMADPASWR